MLLRDGFDWLKNKADFRHRERNIGTVQKPFFIWEDEIPSILHDREIINMINLYVRTKRWGLPFGGGWASQPFWVIEILDALEEAEIEYGKRTINR